MSAALAGVAGSALLANGASAQAPTAPATGVAKLVVPAASAGPAAVVNGEPITFAEVEAVVKAAPPPPAPPTEVQLRQLRKEGVELLIDDVLVRQFLSANAPRISQAEFTKEFDALLTALKAKNLTLQDFLRDNNQTEERLRMDIVKKLQWDQYVNQTVNDSALRKYYDANRDFYDQVTVRASHILFRVPAQASEGERTQAKARLVDLRRKIVTGDIDFAEAAKKYSQCHSAAEGGDLGAFRRKWVVDENIAKAAFALPVGQVSDVVQTESGLHLIKVTDRKPGQPSDFEALKEKVREDFVNEMWYDVVAKQRKVAHIEIKLP
jgi:parvulin-like peptidyl-prolyl isomerase